MNMPQPKPDPSYETKRRNLENKVTHDNPSQIYPESDGEPLAENTLHLKWIFTIHHALNLLLKDEKDVFIASDLLWYPEEGRPGIRRAPDAMVVFGRPKRNMEKVGSYLQWKEEGIAPQVVFEVKSPSDEPQILRDKFNFYQKYGVEEYYLCDPENARTRGWIRKNHQLIELGMTAWTSPQLGIHFRSSGEFHMLLPDGKPFLSPEALYEEVVAERDREKREKEEAQALAHQEKREKENALALVHQEKQEKENALALVHQEKREKENALALVHQEKREKEDALLLAQQEKQEKEEALLLAQREKKKKEEALAQADENAEKMRQMRELMRKMGVDPNSAFS